MAIRRPASSNSIKDDAVDVGTAANAQNGKAAAQAPVTGAFKSIIVPLIAGCFFGAVFQLSRVHEFNFIRDQLLMRRFLMLKMFLTASATSITLLALLPFVSTTAHTRIAAWAKIMSETLASRRGLPALMTGAAMLGTGMAICGSCPGTVFAQVASGSVQARWILFGAFIASVVYPLIDMLPGFASLLAAGGSPVQNSTLKELVGSKGPKLSLIVASMFLSLVAALEYFSPWQSELSPLLPKSEQSFPAAIPPALAGLVVGSLQLPLILLVNNHLGCSSSYMTSLALLGDCVAPGLCAKVPLLQALKSNYWQCFLMAGVSLGAFISSSMFGGVFHSDSMITPIEGIFGGFLLVFGARLAAGCTSGHGISGMGYLAINSFIAVASMFGAGIATANIFYRN